MTYEELADEWDNKNEIRCNTSGSTGTPKIIMLPKRHMLESARRTADFFSLNNDSFLYSCISPDFIGGKMMLARQRLTGCRLGWETPSNRPLANYRGNAITLLSVVPSQMIYILDNLNALPRINNILVGGSAIPPSMRERIAMSGLNAFESYGMTETSSHIALRKIEMTPKPFRTLGNITVENCGGALRINIPGWQSLTTNDAAELISPTEFRILGRLDNVIISGGRKINPEAIEEKLSPLLPFPFFITSRPDDKWGERLVLVAEGDSSLIAQIESACSHLTENYERPKEILTRKHLPRTANGKLIRKIDRVPKI